MYLYRRSQRFKIKTSSYEVLESRYHYNYDYRHLRDVSNEREHFVVAYLPKKATPAAYRILSQLLIGFLSWCTAYECNDATARRYPKVRTRVGCANHQHIITCICNIINVVFTNTFPKWFLKYIMWHVAYNPSD